MWVLLLVGFDVNPVGEPDAGKPQVRFDERLPETEQRSSGRCHRAGGRLYPVIYCGTKYAATLSVFLKSLGQRTVRYASLAHSAKTLNITTPSAPRNENR